MFRWMIIAAALLSRAAFALDFGLQQEVAYTTSAGKDFRQNRAVSRLIELNLGVHYSFLGLPVPLGVGYYFKLPVANAGSDDIGIKKAFSYSHGIDVQSGYDFGGPISLYGRVGYVFMGLTTLEARSALRSEAGNAASEGEIELAISHTGYDFELGGEWQMQKDLALQCGLGTSQAKAKIEKFKLNGLDQRYLVEDIDGRITKHNKIFVGLGWEFH